MSLLPAENTTDRNADFTPDVQASRKPTPPEYSSVPVQKRWDDGINRMRYILMVGGDTDIIDRDNSNAEEETTEDEEVYHDAEEDFPDNDNSTRETSHVDVGTDVRIDYADAISMGYNREQYYLLTVDKESDFLWALPTAARSNALQLLKEYIHVTGIKPARIRCDNAPEFTDKDFVSFCEQNNIVLQYVMAYNHTMNGRIENCVKIVKSHTRAALSASNAPRNFWPDCTKDVINKYNNLVKTTAQGALTTPYLRVRPKAVSNRLTDVFVPFGCKAIGILPKEHPLIKNTSHQNRGFEGIFLRKDDRSEQVWLNAFALRKRMLFHDVHYHKSQFPFRDHGCLSNPKLMDATAVDFKSTPEDSTQPRTRARAAEMSETRKIAEDIVGQFPGQRNQSAPRQLVIPEPDLSAILDIQAAITTGEAQQPSPPLLLAPLPERKHSLCSRQTRPRALSGGCCRKGSRAFCSLLGAARCALLSPASGVPHVW